MHFPLCDPVTLTFDLVFIGRRGIVMYYPCAKFGDRRAGTKNQLGANGVPQAPSTRRQRRRGEEYGECGYGSVGAS